MFLRIAAIVVLSSISVLFGAAADTSAAPTTKNPLTLFSLKKKPPVIDGKLNDECWKGVQTATGFVPLGKVQPAKAETEVMSCYDDTSLYIAVKLAEPNIKSVLVESSPYNGDCVELFLDPQDRQRSYFHIIVDSQGHRYTALNNGTEQPASLEMSVKCGRSDAFWTVELAIPFASLGRRCRRTTSDGDSTRGGCGTPACRRRILPGPPSALSPSATVLESWPFTAKRKWSPT